MNKRLSFLLSVLILGGLALYGCTKSVTAPEGADAGSLEPAPVPFPGFPPIINDPTNRIMRFPLTFPGPVASHEWTFTEPGRYLVICEVLPHFTEAKMYAYVDVK